MKISSPGVGVISLKYFFAIVAIVFIAACSSGDPKKGVAEAKSLYQKGDYKAAVVELKKTLKHHPTTAEARFILGKIYLELGNGKSAVKELALAKKYGSNEQRIPIFLAKAHLINEEYDQVISILEATEVTDTEQKIEVILLKVSALLGMGKTEKAEELLSAAATLDKYNVDLLLAQSRYALSRGRYKEVKDYLALLKDVDAKNIDGVLLSGMLDFQQGEYESASKKFEKVVAQVAGKRFGREEFSARVGFIQSLLALGEKNRAEKAIQDFLSRSPEHPMALYFEALISYDKQDYVKVKDNLQKVLAVRPNHYPSLLLLGAANFAIKNYEQANEYLSKFVDRVPTHLYARKLLGVTRLHLDRSEEALKILKAGVADTGETDSGLLELIGRVAMRTDIKSAVDYFEKASEKKPENVELRKQLAKAYIASGNLDKAIEELNFVGGESALQADALKVFSYLKKSNFTKARSLAEKMLSGHKTDARFYMLRAAVEISAGFKQSAEKYLTKAIELQADYVPAMVALAKLKIQSGDMEAAKDWFGRVAQIQPNNLSASLGLAEIAERQGFPESAIDILKKAGEQHPDEYIPQAALAGYYLQKGNAKGARDLLIKAVKNHDHPNLWQLLGQSYEALQDWEGARDSYQRVISLAPKSASAHVSLAKVFSIIGDRREVEAHLTAALKIAPDFAPAHASLANLAISDADYKKADEIGRDLVGKSPKSPLGFLVLADSAFAQKRYKDAKREYIRAFDLGVNRGALLHAYTNFQNADQGKIALELLEAWLKKVPADNAARLMLATLYQENGRKPAAEKEYRALLKQRPDDPVVLNNLALLRLPKNPLEAKELAEKAYHKAKSNAAIADTFGWVLVHNGEYEQGQKILEDTAKANPHPDIQYHLAFVLAKTGQKQRAKSILSGILASTPVFAERASAEQLLGTL